MWMCLDCVPKAAGNVYVGVKVGREEEVSGSR